MDRPIAWLFSSEHLSAAELQEASVRIKNGEQPEPPEKLLQLAKEAIRKNTIRRTTDRPLTTMELFGIATMCLFLTPLAGFAHWWGFRTERPHAAKQVLWVTGPFAVGFVLLWSAVIAVRLFG